MVLNINNFDAVIFDMDGTIVDNMDIHLKAWQKFCKKHEIRLSKKEFKKKFSGKKNDEYFDILFNKKVSNIRKRRYANEKEEIYRKIYKPKEINGLTNFLKILNIKGIICAIATTAPSKNRNFILGKINIFPYFKLVLGEENIKKSKPHPEIFLKVAKKMSVNPKHCLVFEDTPPGIEAAKKAGMTAIAVLTTFSKAEMQKADGYINDYTEIKIQ